MSFAIEDREQVVAHRHRAHDDEGAIGHDELESAR
jgi:hypothetical protein